MVPDLMNRYYRHFVPSFSISFLYQHIFASMLSPVLYVVLNAGNLISFDYSVNEHSVNAYVHLSGLFFLAKLAALVQCSSFVFKYRGRKINCELVQPVQLKRTELSSLLQYWQLPLRRWRHCKTPFH